MKAAEHATNVRHFAAAAQRDLMRGEILAAPPTERRTKFCTPTGWHTYRDLTPAMRRAILATDGVEGDALPGWVITQTANRLMAMGLVCRSGLAPRLTHHGSMLWCEIDD